MERERYSWPTRARIDLGDSEEVQAWCAALGITPAQLARAVSAVGHEAGRVRKFIRLNPGLFRPGGADETDASDAH